MALSNERVFASANKYQRVVKKEIADLLFTKAQCDAAMPEVVAGMTKYLKRYRTPIYRDRGDHGVGHGSGSYLRLGDRIFVLTNEHVAVALESGERLIYQFADPNDLHAALP
ncbi:hypothetical protein [Mesorhizobium sp. M0013]|uniref:hypothetical protein n=1 Tax=Mesorhizobium sp. M0013 TaxID=2956841 RepID=UPI003334C4A3